MSPFGYLSNAPSYYIGIWVKKLDLYRSPYYSVAGEDNAPCAHSKQKRLPVMKLAVRIFALSVVFVGVAAASASHASSSLLPSHQSATATNPVPLCAPGLPTCPDTVPVQ